MLKVGFLHKLATLGSRHMATVARPAPMLSSLRAGFMDSRALQPLRWVSRLPTVNQPQPAIPLLPETPLSEYLDLDSESGHTMHMDSVLRKRRLKMKKHKLRKRRRTQRALKKRLGKL